MKEYEENYAGDAKIKCIWLYAPIAWPHRIVRAQNKSILNGAPHDGLLRTALI
jgi:hypothetical protein